MRLMKNRSEELQDPLSRRSFLKVIGAGAGWLLLSRCTKEQRALGFEPGKKQVTPFITPNQDFYLVAVDPSFRPSFGVKDVDSRWSLSIEAPGGRSKQLSYGELTGSAQTEFLYTFECIGNPVGGTLIGNARWTGVPMRKILQESGLMSSGIRSVMFRSLDDFYSSISVERALDDYSFLAVQMNGEPLPPSHGFPVRTILPDLYGMKQPRWLNRIVLHEGKETTSFWEERGWAGEVPVKTTSQLDPPVKILAGKPAALTGIAFAGVRGVRSVQVSLNGGERWRSCQLVKGGDPNVWALWRFRWEDPGEGRHSLLVRAVDGTGSQQTGEVADTFPDGATGYDGEQITVQKG
jgi:DMSO/TMAO reductase YedYZ molybdopterin-dependent catalytic subunit